MNNKPLTRPDARNKTNRMKPSALICAICGLLVLTGCANQVWYQPGKTPAEAYQDLRACRTESMRTVDPHGISGIMPGLPGIIGRGRVDDDLADGMKAKGWQPVKRTEQNRDYPPK